MTFGCMFGVCMDPDVEYWDASKINSMRKANGTNASLHGDQVETWLSCNGKRVIQRNTRLVTDFTYSSNTAWPAIRSVEPFAIPGTRTKMTLSNYIHNEGVTLFFVFRLNASSVSLGARNSSVSANSYLGYCSSNGEFIFDRDSCMVRYNGLNKDLGYGMNGTTYPFLLVQAIRIFQSGTSVIVWAMGTSGLVITASYLNTTWVSNPNCFVDFTANLNIHYIEINRDIKTTAQMKARRDVLYNRYV